MEFTDEEVEILRKHFKYSFIHKKGVSQSLNQGFGYWGLFKLDDGRIKEYWWKPLDVDCDDGSVGSYNEGERFYQNLDELINSK